VYMLAASIPLSLAATNIAKLLALLASLVVLAAAIRRRQPDEALARLVGAGRPADAGGLALSLAWTTEPGPQALGDVVKYSKLLLIPAIMPCWCARRARRCWRWASTSHRRPLWCHVVAAVPGRAGVLGAGCAQLGCHRVLQLPGPDHHDRRLCRHLLAPAP
jgi:hypothetical protein